MFSIVSAFITNVNNNRAIDKYILHGTKLLNMKYNKIIYIEEEIYYKYFANNNFINTQFRLLSKSEIYLYNYAKFIENMPERRNIDKDTIDYFFVQCNKTEWIREAIRENYFDSDYFVWIDFGINHVLSFDLNNYNFDITYRNKIRFAGGIKSNDDLYNYPQWFFLGGIFGGPKDKLIQFADLVKNKCINTIMDKKLIMWEINIWYLVYLENPELFDIYFANHDDSMIYNYLNV